jgi:hypothetical protein
MFVRMLPAVSTKKRYIRLTSGEISNLWTSFMNDSMAICGITIFLAQVQDAQIRTVFCNVNGRHRHTVFIDAGSFRFCPAEVQASHGTLCLPDDHDDAAASGNIDSAVYFVPKIGLRLQQRFFLFITSTINVY